MITIQNNDFVEICSYGANELEVKMFGGIPDIRYKFVNNLVVFKFSKKNFLVLMTSILKALDCETIEKLTLNNVLLLEDVYPYNDWEKMPLELYQKNYDILQNQNNIIELKLESSVLRFFKGMTFYKISKWLPDSYYHVKELKRKKEISW